MGIKKMLKISGIKKVLKSWVVKKLKGNGVKKFGC